MLLPHNEKRGKESNMIPCNHQLYEERFTILLKRLEKIKKDGRSSSHLYSIMDSVPFKDLEVAAMMADRDLHKEK